MAANIVNIQFVTQQQPGNQVLGKRGRSDDVFIDVSSPIPYPPTPEVVEAMRQRILQLENELRGSKKPKTTGAMAHTTAVAGPSTLPAPVAASNPKADLKTMKARKKSLFDQLKKAAKKEKYNGTQRTIKIEEHFSQADFELVFDNTGILVQPTASNKPKSSVWIRQYSTTAHYQSLFGDAYKVDQLKGDAWTAGNIHVGPGRKIGSTQLAIQSIEVQWSKNTEKATMKVEINGANMEPSDGYAYYPRMGMW